MAEEFISAREFDGFSKAIRGEIRQVSESNASLHGKLDSLLLKSSEEARAMGELSASVRALESRMEKYEEKLDTLQAAYSNREIRKGDIGIDWFKGIMGAIIAAIMGGALVKLWK